MTDEQLILSRQILLTELARHWRDGGATRAQLLTLFPPPADEWQGTVEQVYAEPFTAAAPAGDAGARDRLVRCIDATLRRPLTWWGQDRTDMLNHRMYLQALAGDDLRRLEAAEGAGPGPENFTG